MNDTTITVVGNVVDSPRCVRVRDGAVTNFRLASTSRRFDREKQEFVDGATLWIDVECWNDLGSHVSSSVAKGDPVIVVGQISTHQWESELGRRSRPQIKADAVGLNLRRGTAVFSKTTAAAPQAADDAEATAAAAAVEPEERDYTDPSRELYELVSESPEPLLV